MPANKGLIIVHTGNGKGKTTAALGMLLRAWGHGLRVCMVQFIKSSSTRTGEARAAHQLGLEWHTLGTGFTSDADSPLDFAAQTRKAWTFALSKIASGDYDLVILDELTHPMTYGWIDPDQVVGWLREVKPPQVHVVITGRDCPPALMELADLVTNMDKVKHPWDQGIAGQPGIEF
jgi:cob(I)alamin adenosyltransferase